MNAPMKITRETDSILRMPDVRRRTGLSAPTIYRREIDGTFPPRIRIGANAVGWYESDIGRWVADPAGYRA